MLPWFTVVNQKENTLIRLTATYNTTAVLPLLSGTIAFVVPIARNQKITVDESRLHVRLRLVAPTAGVRLMPRNTLPSA